MPNLEWEVPHQLISPAAPTGVIFNQIYGGTSGPVPNALYLLQPDVYKIEPGMRVTSDNVSQQDGSVLHPRYTTGLIATLKVFYAIVPTGAGTDVQAACAADLRLMHEFLMINIHSLLRPVLGVEPNTAQRLIWTPTDAGDTRILQAIQTLAWPTVSRDQTQTFVEFEVESPYPYAINGTPTPISMSDGVNVLIPNDGDAPYYPIWEVASGTSSFTIVNNDTPSQAITWASSTPIGSTHAEIVTFDGTMFLNGSSTDLSPGFDPTATDFFPIQPGGTNVQITGGTATVDAHDAYC